MAAKSLTREALVGNAVLSEDAWTALVSEYKTTDAKVESAGIALTAATLTRARVAYAARKFAPVGPDGQTRTNAEVGEALGGVSGQRVAQMVREVEILVNAGFDLTYAGTAPRVLCLAYREATKVRKTSVQGADGESRAESERRNNRLRDHVSAAVSAADKTTDAERLAVLTTEAAEFAKTARESKTKRGAGEPGQTGQSASVPVESPQTAILAHINGALALVSEFGGTLAPEVLTAILARVDVLSDTLADTYASVSEAVAAAA